MEERKVKGDIAHDIVWPYRPPLGEFTRFDNKDADNIQASIKEALSAKDEELKKVREEQQRIGLVLEGYKLLAGLSDPDPFKIQKMIESELAALREENERLKAELENENSDICDQRNKAEAEARQAERRADKAESENKILKEAVESLRSRIVALEAVVEAARAVYEADDSYTDSVNETEFHREGRDLRDKILGEALAHLDQIRRRRG